jgi:hypothetical protein
MEIITERKALDVTPRMVGLGEEVLVQVCVKCGAVVWDVVVHDNFHRVWHRA